MPYINDIPRFTEMFGDLERRIRKLEQAATLQAPSVTADPIEPLEGQIWFRSDLNQLKVYINGSVRTFTVT